AGRALLPLFHRARNGQDVSHRVVPLVARVLEHPVHRLALPRKRQRPLLRPPPFPPTAVMPLRFFVTTTSVFPSQCPRESPIYEVIVAGRCERPWSGTTRAS